MGAYVIEHLGHISVEEFVKLLGRYYSRAFVLRQPKNEPGTINRSEFPTSLRRSARTQEYL